MSPASRQWTITLRDGARVMMRPITPADKPLLAASFERLSEESRYRRFFTSMNKLSEAQLDYLVDVDHEDHEAIVAVDPISGEGLAVARYIRSSDAAEAAEVAITVADDWQGRGLGSALLDRLTYRARREGVRRFTALVQADNRASLGLLAGVGDTTREYGTGVVELVIELPPERGMGVQLNRALRAAAAGALVPARTLAHRVVGSSPRPLAPPGRPIRTIVVGVDGSETGAKTLAVALRLAAGLGAAVHVVSAYSGLQGLSEAEAVLAAAMRAVHAEGLEAVTHALRDSPAGALTAVAEEENCDLLVVGSGEMRRASRVGVGVGVGVGSVANHLSHHAPCSVLIVRTDSSLSCARVAPQTRA